MSTSTIHLPVFFRPARQSPSRPTLLAWLCLSMMLSACTTVGPDFKPPQTAAPERWSDWHGGSDSRQALPTSDEASMADASTWQDPVLQALLDRAMTANADVRTAALRLSQSRSQLQVTSASEGPKLGVRASAMRQRQSESSASLRLVNAISPKNKDALAEVLSTPFNEYDAGFDASWEIDLWGRVSRSIEAAQAQAEAMESMLGHVQQTILAEVARRYFELRGAQQDLRLAKQEIQSLQTMLDVQTGRAKSGIISDMEVTKSRNALIDRQARLPLVVLKETQVANQLTLLTGERPGALADLLTYSRHKHEEPALPDLSPGVPSALAQRRFDIMEAQARLHAATAQIGVAMADLYPRITLGAGFGLRGIAADSFAEWGSRQWSIGPNLQLPLFDGGRRKATVTLTTLQQQEAAVNFQQTVLKAWHEVDLALSGYDGEQERVKQLNVKVQDNQSTWSTMQARRRSGLVDSLAEEEAALLWRQAQRELNEAQTSRSTQLVAVYKSLGMVDRLHRPHPTDSSTSR